MKMQIEVKNVYGNLLVYPIGDLAEKFAKLIGKKTFSHADLCIIESMGILIQEVKRNSYEFTKSK